MCFPTYRQQGLLIAQDWPMVDMMCQVLLERQGTAEGPPAAGDVFGAGGRLLLDLRQPRHAVHPGGRLGDGVGDQGRHARSRRPGSATAATAEGDFHTALTFASVYRAPVILNVVNNQWAISTFQAIAGGEATTFAARGIGCGIPSLRVDGNDFLAVYAAVAWAAERARSNLGPTLIEWVTYRAGAAFDLGRSRPNTGRATIWRHGRSATRSSG